MPTESRAATTHTGSQSIATSAPVLLEVENLAKHFPVMRGVFRRQVGSVRAVDGVDFQIRERETLGLVGESGCGKSTAGRVILRLHDPTAGRIAFRGEDIGGVRGESLRRLRRRMQMIFQDPQDSLNPRMTVGSIVGEPLVEHGVAKGRALDGRVDGLLDAVGLSARFANRYPHEFSGGQRQRIGIARALALEPEFIVCDEPVRFEKDGEVETFHRPHPAKEAKRYQVRAARAFLERIGITP